MAEIIRIRTNCNLIKSVVSEIISIRKLIENRDIGDFVGQSVTETALTTSPQTIRLTVMLYSLKFPPFKKGKSITYKIPDADRTKLTWANIKAACGGDNGYYWGRFKCTANLNNGRQMQVWGGSELEAETRLKALLSLSTAKILTASTSEQKKEGVYAEDQPLYKATTRVYPGFFSILDYKKIATEVAKGMQGVTKKLSGNYKRKTTKKIPIWLPKEPANASTLIKQALTIV